jgi:hypothetical protein
MKKLHLIALFMLIAPAIFSQRISELPAASTVGSSDLMVIVQNGVTKKVAYEIAFPSNQSISYWEELTDGIRNVNSNYVSINTLQVTASSSITGDITILPLPPLADRVEMVQLLCADGTVKQMTPKAFYDELQRAVAEDPTIRTTFLRDTNTAKMIYLGNTNDYVSIRDDDTVAALYVNGNVFFKGGSADVDGNGDVNMTDFGLMAESFGKPDSIDTYKKFANMDVDGNSEVNWTDVYVANNCFGELYPFTGMNASKLAGRVKAGGLSGVINDSTYWFTKNVVILGSLRLGSMMSNNDGILRYDTGTKKLILSTNDGQDTLNNPFPDVPPETGLSNVSISGQSEMYIPVCGGTTDALAASSDFTFGEGALYVNAEIQSTVAITAPLFNGNVQTMPNQEDHIARGNRLYLPTSVNVAIGDACYVTSNGKLAIGDADAIATSSCLFMATESLNANTSGYFLTMGTVRDDSWNWTVGGLIYLSTSGTTGNSLTQTAPSGMDDVIQILGVALSADMIYFTPNLMQIEHN